MAKERSSKAKSSRKGTSPTVKKRQADRLLRELQIVGTAALGGGQIAPKRGRASTKVRGVSYDYNPNSADPWSYESEEKATAATIAATSVPRSKRTAAKREASPSPPLARISKKRKREAIDDDIGESIVVAPPASRIARTRKKLPPQLARKSAKSIPEPAIKQRKTAPRDQHDEERVNVVLSVTSGGDADTALPAAADAEFLAETILRAQQANFPRKRAGHTENREMLEYLEALEPLDEAEVEVEYPKAGRIPGRVPDAYLLDDEQAKLLFAGNKRILAPVFLTDEQLIPLVTQDSETSYIEQILDWLPDDDEKHSVSAWNHKTLEDDNVSMSDLRERFLDRNPTETQILYPWNLREIVLPTVAETMPDPFIHPHCNLVRDLLRYLQDTALENICKPGCESYPTSPDLPKTAENCNDHFITIDEAIFLQRISRNWLGTIMLAEPGAYTHPHIDTFGFGTYIGCAAGEIGIAWRPGEPAKTKSKAPTPKDRWVYKILREGEGVYIDPGRVHLVFRCRGRAPTLAWSTRVLRYCDFRPWLSVIEREVQNALNGNVEDPDYILAWRGLLLSARRILELGERKKAGAKFGGLKAIDAALRDLQVVEESLRQLLE